SVDVVLGIDEAPPALGVRLGDVELLVEREELRPEAWIGLVLVVRPDANPPERTRMRPGRAAEPGLPLEHDALPRRQGVCRREPGNAAADDEDVDLFDRAAAAVEERPQDPAALDELKVRDRRIVDVGLDRRRRWVFFACRPAAAAERAEHLQ